MKMQTFKIAFRNVFRNGKRSLFTIIAFVIAIGGVIFGYSYITGMQNLMMNEGIDISGHVRITTFDYELKERQLDVSSNIPYQEIRDRFQKNKDIKNISARIKFGSLVFKDDEDEQAIGFGIEQSDYEVLEFDRYIIAGSFLDYNSEFEILLGAKVAEKLSIKIGDEVTLLTSTQHSSVSAFNYTVVGIYQMDNSRLNQSFYITISDAEYLLDMEDYSTELLVFLNNTNDTDKVSEEIKDKLQDFELETEDTELLIKNWDQIGLNEYLMEMLPIVKFYFLLIFAILSGVGISNTMMMVVYERRKEIGILRSMGMTGFEIKQLLLLEGLLLGIIGTLIGAALGGGVAFYYSKRGIFLGEILEVLSGQYNLGTTVYPVIELQTIVVGIILGVITALISTYMAVAPELKKKAVENLRVE